MTTLDNAVVLVTGANGGLGRQFVRQALARGAKKVYATARTPQPWEDDRIVPIELDVNNSRSIAAAVAVTGDTTIVINNAGVAGAGSIIGSTLDEIREVFETNVFGAIAVAQGYAPVLANNGGGALVDVHSVLSWLAYGGGYSASKAAFWSATNSIRLELAPNGTHVVGLHLGYTDTPMTAGIDADKADPADIVRAALDGIEAGDLEVIADDVSRVIKSQLSSPIETMYPNSSPPDEAPARSGGTDVAGEHDGAAYRQHATEG
jgi:NAD(P)-dependent dehydrogenase (short-subunit alcohol dehydrogenase family)